MFFPWVFGFRVYFVVTLNFLADMIELCLLLSFCEAKKQRNIQVMDIHEIPKPKNKNVFFGKNKGGGGHGGSQGRRW